MKQYHVVKKSAGYSCKSFNEESKAREFAAKCCKANNNQNYIVCIYLGGLFKEI